MGQTADELRQEIDQKRDDAAGKIDEIESRVQGTAQMARDTVEDAKTSVTDTMEQAKSTVTDTVSESVDAVKQGVQDFDFQKYVEERPLVSLGAAFFGGIILGGILGGGDDSGSRGGSRGEVQYDSGQRRSGVSDSLRKAAKDSGLEEQISGMGAMLMGTVTERVRSAVEQNAPGLMDKVQERVSQAGSGSSGSSSTESGSRIGARVETERRGGVTTQHVERTTR